MCHKSYSRAGGRSKIQPRQEEGCQVGGEGGGSFKSMCKPKNLPRQLPGLPAGLRRPCIAVRVVLINAHGRGGGGGGG